MSIYIYMSIATICLTPNNYTLEVIRKVIRYVRAVNYRV